MTRRGGKDARGEEKVYGSTLRRMLDALDTNAFYAFGIPAYVVVMAFEHWLTRRRGKTSYQFADTLGNASAELGEVVIDLFLRPLYLRLYKFGHAHWALVR